MALDLAVPTTPAPLLLGAVTYDPKVVTIWEGFRAFFNRRGLPFDFVLYSHYERQVQALLAGEIHVSWSSPLAYLQAERLARARGQEALALAMRDSDRDLTSVIVVRADAPLESVADLRGKRVAVGAPDSPQATLIPLEALAEAGLAPGQDCEVQIHDRLAGKHGDHVGGEREAARALLAGRADAACLLDTNLLLFAQEGTLPASSVRVLLQTPPYDHCNFTALGSAPADACARFVELLLAMDHGDPQVRPLLDLEGLKAWTPGRTSGYAQLARAVDRFGVLEGWLAAAR